MIFILSSTWGIMIRGLWKLPNGRDWLWRKLGLILVGRDVLSKSLIQFSVDGRGCVPTLLFDLRQNQVGVMKIMVTSFKTSCAHTIAFSTFDPAAGHCLPKPLPETPGQLQGSLGQSPVRSLFLSPGSWCAKVLFVCSKSLFPHSCGSSVIKSHWPPKSNSLGISGPFARSPSWKIYCGS